ncbi:MAG: hypothetical protein K2X82_06285 [Gemmataceae bacterium]|nr:hypothetical protein [Gemmataceae bacterium]
MRILTGGSGALGPLAFSPDGRRLAAYAAVAAVGQPYVCVWDSAAGPGPTWAGLPTAHGGRVVFEPDGRHLVVWQWAVAWRVEVGTWAVADEPVLTTLRPAAIAADGRTAVGEPLREGKRVTIRAAASGPTGWAPAAPVELEYNARFDGLGGGAVLLDPTGRRVVRVRARRRHGQPYTVGEFGLQSFDRSAGRVLGEWVGEVPVYCQRLVGPGGVVVLLRDRALFAVHLDEPKSAPVKRLNTSAKHFTDAAFSPDGRWLATTSNDALVTLWDTATWQPARQYEWKIGRLRSVAFSPDGTLCAAGSDTGRVVVWDFDG